MTAPPLARTVLLHLLPGVLTGLLYLGLGRAFHARGWPVLWALMLATALALLPFEWAVLRAAGWPQGKRLSGRTLGLTALLTLLGAALLPGLAVPFQPLFDRLIASLPAWFPLEQGIQELRTLPSPLLELTLVAWVGLFVLLGPVVEEAYFRGLLLPRLAHLGRWAAPLNALLFALYHVWQPQGWLRVFLTALPLSLAARASESTLPGVVAHVTVNLLAALLLFRPA